jgi:hypothetical protein
LVVGGGVLSVPSPAALVVIGVGGPIGLVGGVMFEFAGGVLVFVVGAGAVGIVAFGAVVCVGGVGVAVAVGGGGGGAAGAAVRVRCAATQLAQVRIAISRISRFAMGFSSLRTDITAQRAKLRCVCLS